MDMCAEHLVSILLAQMEIVGEQFTTNLERCEIPPFYKFQCSTEIREKDIEQITKTDGGRDEIMTSGTEVDEELQTAIAKVCCVNVVLDEK